MCPPSMAMLHLTLRLHKIYHIARKRQVPYFNSCMQKMCTIEYNLPPTYLLFAIYITAGTPKFHNFCKNSDLFFGTWADNVSRKNKTDSSQCPYITKPSAVSVFNGPFAKTLLQLLYKFVALKGSFCVFCWKHFCLPYCPVSSSLKSIRNKIRRVFIVSSSGLRLRVV